MTEQGRNPMTLDSIRMAPDFGVLESDRNPAELNSIFTQANNMRDDLLTMVDGRSETIAALTAALAAKTEECERLQDAVGLLDTLPEMGGASVLVARVAELEAALREYGQHTPSCLLVHIIGGRTLPSTCSCGLDAALSGAKETYDE